MYLNNIFLSNPTERKTLPIAVKLEEKKSINILFYSTHVFKHPLSFDSGPVRGSFVRTRCGYKCTTFINQQSRRAKANPKNSEGMIRTTCCMPIFPVSSCYFVLRSGVVQFVCRQTRVKPRPVCLNRNAFSAV